MTGQKHWSAGGRILLSSRGHKSTDTEERILFWERTTIQYMHGPYFSQQVISLDFISPAYRGGKCGGCRDLLSQTRGRPFTHTNLPCHARRTIYSRSE